MSTTLTRSAVESGKHIPGLRLDPMRHRRRPALAVGCLALVIACVAVFVSAYLKAGNQVAVLAVERTVPQGQVLTVDDLTVVRMSMTASIASVPAAEASEVVGRRAAERLEPDTLLTASDLVESYSPPAGQSIVGVATKEGQLPASGVAPGETVDVIFTGSPGEQASSDNSAVEQPGVNGATVTAGGEPSLTGTVLVPDASVLEATASPASSGSDAVDVSLLVPATLAPLVANASAAGQVALVVVAPGS